MYPGRVVCMFSLNESVRGGSREGSSGISWQEQPFSWDLLPAYLLARCMIWDSVTYQHFVPQFPCQCPRGVVRLAACRPSAEEGRVYTTCTLLLAHASAGLFSRTVPSPAGIEESRCPSGGSSGKDWKVESAHRLSSVTVEM